MTAFLEARGVTKRFGDTVAVNGLELVAEQGEIWPSWGATARARPRWCECWRL